MTVRDQMLAELAKGPLCDDCLGEILGKRRQAFNALGRDLEGEGRVKRPKGLCPRCQKEKTVNYLVGAQFDPKPAPKASVKPAGSEHAWYWEGNVQDRLVEYLHQQGYRITQVVNTAAKTPGIDVIAVQPNGKQLMITVKGYPEGTNPYTQARHYFAETVFDVAIYKQSHPEADFAIALPDGFKTYLGLIPRVRWFLAAASCRVFLVREDGTVRVEVV